MKSFIVVVLFFAGAVYADETVVGETDEPPQTCQEEYDAIEATIADIVEKTGSYPIGTIKPQCLDDGTYAARQCLGSICRCVAADGTVLTKNDFSIGEAVNTDCSCARAEYEYSLLNIVGKIFRCTDIGSYEPIQCTGSVCYCADARGEQLGQKALNIAFIDSLEC